MKHRSTTKRRDGSALARRERDGREIRQTAAEVAQARHKRNWRRKQKPDATPMQPYAEYRRAQAIARVDGNGVQCRRGYKIQRAEEKRATKNARRQWS